MSELLNEKGYDFTADAMKSTAMTRADVDLIIEGFRSSFTDSINNLAKVVEGHGFQEANSALWDLSQVIQSGSHKDFYRENKSLSNPAERSKFLAAAGGQSSQDKQAVCGLYDIIAQTEKLSGDFERFLTDVTTSVLLDSYKAIRFEKEMRDIFTSDERGRIIGAFKEFDQMCMTYQAGGIADVIGIDKTVLDKTESLILIESHMNKALADMQDLGNYLGRINAIMAGAVNKLFAIDRKTEAFADILDKEDRIKAAQDACGKLTVQFGTIDAKGVGISYIAGYKPLLDMLNNVFTWALAAIERFRTEQEETPHSALHYPQVVVSCVEKYGLGTVGNPLKNGTDYYGFVNRMPKVLPQIAKDILNSVY